MTKPLPQLVKERLAFDEGTSQDDAISVHASMPEHTHIQMLYVQGARHENARTAPLTALLPELIKALEIIAETGRMNDFEADSRRIARQALAKIRAEVEK